MQSKKTRVKTTKAWAEVWSTGDIRKNGQRLWIYWHAVFDDAAPVVILDVADYADMRAELKRLRKALHKACAMCVEENPHSDLWKAAKSGFDDPPLRGKSTPKGRRK